MVTKDSSDDETEQYEHDGTWDCEACGESFEAENKLDPLTHIFTCGISSSNDGRGMGHDGYRRRKLELEEVTA